MHRATVFLMAGWGLVAVIGMAIPAAAQDRLPRIPADKMTEAQREAVAEFRLHRGRDISGPFIPLLRSPELMVRTTAMGDYLRYKTVLGPHLNEFVILLTARHWGQGYEWSVHQPTALEAGVSPDIVAAIGEGRMPGGMSADETLAYDICTEVLRTQHLSDATYARAIARFGEHGVVDMVGVIGYYSFLGLVLNVAQTPAGTPGLPALAPPAR